MSFVRRRFSKAPVQLADGFARRVRRTPDSQLERLMSGRARRAILDGIFWQMPRHLNRRQAAGMNAVLQWRITSPGGAVDGYRLSITGQGCRVTRRTIDPAAHVTITLSGSEFLRVITGSSDPMQGYLSGRIKIAGDIMLAAKLQSLFRMPGSG